MLKYQAIAQQIEHIIESDALEQGAKLPSVEQLVQTFAVSKSTITKALLFLEKQGRIYQVQGSGIFVRQTRRDGYINLYRPWGFSDDLQQDTITSHVLLLELQSASNTIAQALRIEPAAEVYYVKRLRYKNQQPFCLEESYFPKAIVPVLTADIAAGSLFRYFTASLQINPSFSDSYLHITQLDESTAELFALPFQAPALISEQIIYLSTGEPFDYARITYHYQHSQFFLATSK